MGDDAMTQHHQRSKAPRESWFDTLISELPEHEDAKPEEKGSIFRSAEPLVWVTVAVVSLLIAFLTG